ncbi:MAG: fasciclin domain-containing protein [Thermomicrobiales bacterium]|jgi:uncharacterized surface protein with fasciclin (FAS1) repeats|nr:MAG: fasciclin domain-containing protein [Thermomicrobiales bacterium]
MRRIALIASAALIAVGIAAAPVAARQPGPTIVEAAIAVNADTGEFSQLIAAVSRAGLVDTLNGNRQFTVFAPTDAAFEALYGVLGVNGVDQIDLATLKGVLLYHVAPGERFSDDVLGASRVRMLSKSFTYPSLDGSTPYINNAQILIPDIDVSNGVIHVIDAVLLP